MCDVCMHLYIPTLSLSILNAVFVFVFVCKVSQDCIPNIALDCAYPYLLAMYHTHCGLPRGSACVYISVWDDYNIITVTPSNHRDPILTFITGMYVCVISWILGYVSYVRTYVLKCD